MTSNVETSVQQMSTRSPLRWGSKVVKRIATSCAAINGGGTRSMAGETGARNACQSHSSWV